MKKSVFRFDNMAIWKTPKLKNRKVSLGNMEFLKYSEYIKVWYNMESQKIPEILRVTKVKFSLLTISKNMIYFKKKARSIWNLLKTRKRLLNLLEICKAQGDINLISGK